MIVVARNDLQLGTWCPVNERLISIIDEIRDLLEVSWSHEILIAPSSEDRRQLTTAPKRVSLVEIILVSLGKIDRAATHSMSKAHDVQE